MCVCAWVWVWVGAFSLIKSMEPLEKSYDDCYLDGQNHISIPFFSIKLENLARDLAETDVSSVCTSDGHQYCSPVIITMYFVRAASSKLEHIAYYMKAKTKEKATLFLLGEFLLQWSCLFVAVILLDSLIRHREIIQPTRKSFCSLLFSKWEKCVHRE